MMRCQSSFHPYRSLSLPLDAQEAKALEEGYGGIRRDALQPLQNLFAGEFNGKGWRRFVETGPLLTQRKKK
jgi:hypothetical protein